MAALEAMLSRKAAAVQSGEAEQTTWFRESDRTGARYADGEYVYAMEDASQPAVRIEETFNELGTRVWDAAILAGKYFEHQAATGARSFEGLRVLELGAGCGLTSIVLARLGCGDVLATDRGPVVEHMAAQFAANCPGLPVRAAELDWFSAEQLAPVAAQPWDLVVGIDICLHAMDNPALLTVLEATVGAETELLLFNSAQRDGTASLMSYFADGYAVREIPDAELHPGFLSEQIGSHSLTRLAGGGALGGSAGDGSAGDGSAGDGSAGASA